MSLGALERRGAAATRAQQPRALASAPAARNMRRRARVDTNTPHAPLPDCMRRHKRASAHLCRHQQSQQPSSTRAAARSAHAACQPSSGCLHRLAPLRVQLKSLCLMCLRRRWARCWRPRWIEPSSSPSSPAATQRIIGVCLFSLAPSVALCGPCWRTPRALWRGWPALPHAGCASCILAPYIAPARACGALRGELARPAQVWTTGARARHPCPAAAVRCAETSSMPAPLPSRVLPASPGAYQRRRAPETPSLPGADGRLYIVP